MRPRATRLSIVLACAPVAALWVSVLAPHAAAQTAAPPRPYVLAIDPGHGGTPDNAHPDVPFDSGAIGVNGLLEKDLTLDIAQRVRDLLEADSVAVAMTRQDDRFISIEDRLATAETAHASLFVSVHLNSFTDAGVGGSLVLYPNQAAAPFASVMSATLARELAPQGIAGNGTQLRDNWWVHATMPTVTVEGAYLTNGHEARLLAGGSFRQSLAQAIHDGIEAFDPGILRQRDAITAWNADHPNAPVTVGREHLVSGGVPWRPALALLAATALMAAVAWRGREAVAQTVVGLRQAVTEFGPAGLLTRPAPRRRRRQLRQRQIADQARRVVRPHSVYDELWF